jgi:ABC-type nitrate/sulfonate/bicarbonate transport system substrate-binding protein
MVQSKRYPHLHFLPGLICLVIFLNGCRKPASTVLDPIIIQLTWTHNAQFAGMYAADQLGYYSTEGLKVTFLQGGPGLAPIEVVRSGAARFGVTSADVLLMARASAKPVSAIAVIYGRSPRVYIALADSGITSPQEFTGKTISVNTTARAPFEALMKQLGIQPDQYNLVDSTSDLAPFYSGEVQVRSVYLPNEVITIRNAGYAVNIIYPDDYGIHNYGDTMIDSDDLIAKKPDLVLRFLRATLKGWSFAIENSSETGPMSAYYNIAADPTLEIKKITASIPLVNTGEDQIGWMRPEIWAGMEKVLRIQGEINLPLDVSQVFTLQFLQEIYK